MKIKPQTGDVLSHLGEKLKDHRIAMLTLEEPPTGLSSRPMTPLEMDEQGAIWFLSSRATLGHVIGSGGLGVNLAFVRHDVSDYVSIGGHAELVDDSERKKALWSAAARVWFSGPEDPDLTLLKVSPRHAEIWDGPDSRALRVLAMAASVVAGREVGMGSKEEFDVPPRG